MLLFLTLFASAQEALPTTEAEVPPPIDGSAYEAPPAGIVHVGERSTGAFVVVDSADRQVRIVVGAGAGAACDARLVAIDKDGSPDGPERTLDRPVPVGAARSLRLPDGADRWQLRCGTAEPTVLAVGAHRESNALDPEKNPLKVKHRVAPVYPDAAKRNADRKVTCRVRMHVDAKGKPTGIEVMWCPDVFRDALDVALGEWRFFPARDDSGKRIAAWTDQSILFFLIDR